MKKTASMLSQQQRNNTIIKISKHYFSHFKKKKIIISLRCFKFSTTLKILPPARSNKATFTEACLIFPILESETNRVWPHRPHSQWITQIPITLLSHRSLSRYSFGLPIIVHHRPLWLEYQVFDYICWSTSIRSTASKRRNWWPRRDWINFLLRHHRPGCDFRPAMLTSRFNSPESREIRRNSATARPPTT